MKNLSDNEVYDLMSSTNDEVSFENIIILFEAFSEMNKARFEEKSFDPIEEKVASK